MKSINGTIIFFWWFFLKTVASVSITYHSYNIIRPRWWQAFVSIITVLRFKIVAYFEIERAWKYSLFFILCFLPTGKRSGQTSLCIPEFQLEAKVMTVWKLCVWSILVLFSKFIFAPSSCVVWSSKFHKGCATLPCLSTFYSGSKA